MHAYYKFYSLSMKKFTLQKSILMKFGEVIVVLLTYVMSQMYYISPIGFIKIG